MSFFTMSPFLLGEKSENILNILWKDGGAAIAQSAQIFFFNSWDGTFGTAATTGLLYQPRMIGDGDCGEIGGMKIGRGNRSTWR
jgi:hypothetical protein